MLTFTDACNQFYSYMLNERCLSERTIDTYKEGLSKFEQFLNEKSSKLVSDITSDLIRMFIAEVRKKGKSASSVNTWLASIKSLFKFLLKKSFVNNDPTLSIGSLKKNKRLPSFFTDDQMSFLLNQKANEEQNDNSLLNRFLSLRDKSMIELMYSSGLRVSEVVMLDLNKIYLESRQLKVIGKGNKERIVPFGKPAHDAIVEYLKIRSLFAEENEQSVFINQFGNRTTARNIEMRLKIYAKTHGFNKEIHPHKLRHSFATVMVNNSHNVRVVQELLGHERLSTTQIYSHTDISSLSRIYELAHPRDKMEKRQCDINKKDLSNDLP